MYSILPSSPTCCSGCTWSQCGCSWAAQHLGAPICLTQKSVLPSSDSRSSQKGQRKQRSSATRPACPGQPAAPPWTRQAPPPKPTPTSCRARKQRTWRRSSATAGDVRARSASGSTTKEPGGGACRAAAAATASAASGGGASANSADGASHALRAASAPLSLSSCAASTSFTVVGVFHPLIYQVNDCRPSVNAAWPGARVSPRARTSSRSALSTMAATLCALMHKVSPKFLPGSFWGSSRISPRFPAPRAAARSRPWPPRCVR